MLRKTINFTLFICLLIPSIGYAQGWWDWLWGTNKESAETSLPLVRPLNLDNRTSLEKIRTYRHEVLQKMVSDQVQILDRTIKSLRRELSKDLDEETRKNTINAINRSERSLNFVQTHGIQAYLGLTQWPTNIVFSERSVRVNESGEEYILVVHLTGPAALKAARKEYLKNEAAFQNKYGLTNRQMRDFEEELKKEYPGLEKKNTGTFFSPLEQDGSLSLLPNKKDKLPSIKQNISTTWKTTMPGTFSESRFTGGSEIFNRLKQWWQAKPSLISPMRQQFGEKAKQVTSQYKESIPATFGEAKFRGSSQVLQKIRERWQK